VSVTRVPAALRGSVRLRAHARCEYCGIHEDDAFEAHEPDHVIAEQHGGRTSADNLAFSCWECNRRKGPNISSIDPESGEITRLFNPRLDQWELHFYLDGLRVLGRTAIGRATVALLRFNSAENLAVREALHKIGRYPSL